MISIHPWNFYIASTNRYILGMGFMRHCILDRLLKIIMIVAVRNVIRFFSVFAIFHSCVISKMDGIKCFFPWGWSCNNHDDKMMTMVFLPFCKHHSFKHDSRALPVIHCTSAEWMNLKILNMQFWWCDIGCCGYHVLKKISVFLEFLHMYL